MEKRKEFNRKAWYRLLKVAFVTTFILVCAIYATITLADAQWKELDQENTKVTCGENRQTENYEKPITFKLSEVNAEIPEGFFSGDVFDYKNFFLTADQDYYYHAYDLFNIFSECFPDREKDISSISTIYFVQRVYELVKMQGLSYEEAREMASASYDESIAAVGYYGPNELLFNYHLFEVVPNYRYVPFIWPLLLGLLAVAFIFELTRRLFYYIAFGDFLFSDYSKMYSRLRGHFQITNSQK